MCSNWEYGSDIVRYSSNGHLSTKNRVSAETYFCTCVCTLWSWCIDMEKYYKRWAHALGSRLCGILFQDCMNTYPWMHWVNLKEYLHAIKRAERRKSIICVKDILDDRFIPLLFHRYLGLQEEAWKSLSSMINRLARSLSGKAMKPTEHETQPKWRGKKNKMIGHVGRYHYYLMQRKYLWTKNVWFPIVAMEEFGLLSFQPIAPNNTKILRITSVKYEGPFDEQRNGWDLGLRMKPWWTGVVAVMLHPKCRTATALDNILCRRGMQYLWLCRSCSWQT